MLKLSQSIWKGDWRILWKVSENIDRDSLLIPASAISTYSDFIYWLSTKTTKNCFLRHKSGNLSFRMNLSIASSHRTTKSHTHPLDIGERNQSIFIMSWFISSSLSASNDEDNRNNLPGGVEMSPNIFCLFSAKTHIERNSFPVHHLALLCAASADIETANKFYFEFTFFCLLALVWVF